MQKGTYAQQVGGGRMFPLHALPDQPEGGHDRVGMVVAWRAATREEASAMLPIGLEIVRQAASRFFNIRSCLIQGERQPVQDLDQPLRRSILIGSADSKLVQVLLGGCWIQHFGPAQDRKSV